MGDGAVLFLFGASLFAATVLPPPLRDGAAVRVRRVARAAAPLALAATLSRLPLQAAAMSGGWSGAGDLDTLADVLTGTSAGRAWAVQTGFAALLLAAAARRGSPPAIAAGAGLALASLALSGHAASEPGPAGWIAASGLALHLLAAGAWIGSLPEVVRLVAMLRRPGPGDHAADAARALRRFSAAGHGVVGLLVGTGAADALLIAGLSGAWPASAYGAVLAAKLGLAGAMAALAVVNRYGLVPRLACDPAAGDAIVANTRGILWLGLAAVAASGLLGWLDPH